MSFILDALKKSDSQRRLGQPPGLDTPVEGPAGGGNRAAWMAGLILLVGVLVTTLVWREWSGFGLLGMAGVVDSPHAPTAETAEPASPDPAPPVLAEATEEDPPARRRESRAGADTDRDAAPREVSPGEDDRRAARRRGERGAEPVVASAPMPAAPRQRQRDMEPEELDAEARLAARREALERAEREAEREAEEREQRLARERLASIPEPEEVRPDPDEPVEPGDERARDPGMVGVDPDSRTVGGSQDEFQPDRRAYMERWELPPGVRRDLPDLRLTMHVYSQDPDSRFVLVNSDRFREGEEVAPGIHLAEIRREGAVLDYRNYRFLLTQ